MLQRKFKFWGWGYADEGASDEERERLKRFYAQRFSVSQWDEVAPPLASEITLPASRLRVRGALAAICSSDAEDRLIHSYGKSYPDSVRAFARQYPAPPDLVIRPRDENEVVAALDFADAVNAAVIPFGGGSSVVGGVETAVEGDFSGVISLNLQHLDRVLAVPVVVVAG